MIFLFCFRRALRRGESVKYLLQDVVIDYIRANHLYGVEDKWVRAAWILSQCLCTITISVHQAVYVSNCLPLSLFISYKFVQDCHQLSEFQIFFFLFLEKSILIRYRYFYLLYGIYISSCTRVLSVMIRPSFHFYHTYTF